MPIDHKFRECMLEAPYFVFGKYFQIGEINSDIGTHNCMRTTLTMLMLTTLLGAAQETDPAPRASKPSPKEAQSRMIGLEVGDQAPAFTLKDQDGMELELNEILKKGPAALIFYRSADW